MRGGRGYSCEFLVGVCRPVLQILIPRRTIKHANIIGIVALGNLFVCSQYSLVRKFVVAKVNKDCHICCFMESMNIFWFL